MVSKWCEMDFVHPQKGASSLIPEFDFRLCDFNGTFLGTGKAADAEFPAFAEPHFALAQKL